MPPSQSKLSPAAVIGLGRVGLALALFLDRIGVEVTLGARSDRARERVEAAGLAVTDPTAATRGASLVLLTVPDDELPSLVTALAADGAFAADQVVVHTAGVDGPGLLAPAAAAGARTAACHPVQTQRRPRGHPWPPARHRLGVTGDLAGREVVTTLGGRPMDVPGVGPGPLPRRLGPGRQRLRRPLGHRHRPALRAGGVIDPAALLSGLIHASVDSALATGQAGLSGPWVRGDGRTVAMHTEALARKQRSSTCTWPWPGWSPTGRPPPAGWTRRPGPGSRPACTATSRTRSPTSGWSCSGGWGGVREVASSAR